MALVQGAGAAIGSDLLCATIYGARLGNFFLRREKADTAPGSFTAVKPYDPVPAFAELLVVRGVNGAHGRRRQSAGSPSSAPLLLPQPDLPACTKECPCRHGEGDAGECRRRACGLRASRSLQACC